MKPLKPREWQGKPRSEIGSPDAFIERANKLLDENTAEAVAWLESLDNLMHPTVTTKRRMIDIMDDDEHGADWQQHTREIMFGQFTEHNKDETWRL